VCVKH